MKLYEIDKELRSLWDKIAEQDGELTEDDINSLNTLELAKNDKITGYGVIIKETKAEIDKFMAERERIDGIIKAYKNKVEWLKNNLEYFMKSNEIDRFDGIEVSIKFRKSKALEIDENTEIPEEFIKVKKELDKTAITGFIKNGGHIDGCRIVEKENIQIK